MKKHIFTTFLALFAFSAFLIPEETGFTSSETATSTEGHIMQCRGQVVAADTRRTALSPSATLPKSSRHSPAIP